MDGHNLHLHLCFDPSSSNDTNTVMTVRSKVWNQQPYGVGSPITTPHGVSAEFLRVLRTDVQALRPR